MKKVLILGCIAIISASIFLFVRPDTITAKLQIQRESEKELLYRDIFITLLMPEVDKAIEKYYSQFLKEVPGEDPWMVDIIDIQRPNGDRTSFFIIEFEVMPYLGPHNSVGKDRITIQVKYGEEPEVIKFEHLESFPIPEHYQNVIKTNWPPEP